MFNDFKIRVLIAAFILTLFSSTLGAQESIDIKIQSDQFVLSKQLATYTIPNDLPLNDDQKGALKNSVLNAFGNQAVNECFSHVGREHRQGWFLLDSRTKTGEVCVVYLGNGEFQTSYSNDFTYSPWKIFEMGAFIESLFILLSCGVLCPLVFTWYYRFESERYDVRLGWTFSKSLMTTMTLPALIVLVPYMPFVQNMEKTTFDLLLGALFALFGLCTLWKFGRAVAFPGIFAGLAAWVYAITYYSYASFGQRLSSLVIPLAAAITFKLIFGRKPYKANQKSETFAEV